MDRELEAALEAYVNRRMKEKFASLLGDDASAPARKAWVTRRKNAVPKAPAAGRKLCPHCQKPLRSDNTKGLCTPCWKKGKRPSPAPASAAA